MQIIKKSQRYIRHQQQQHRPILMLYVLLGCGDQNKVAEQRRECSPDNCDPSSKLTPAALQHVPQRPPHPRLLYTGANVAGYTNISDLNIFFSLPEKCISLLLCTSIRNNSFREFSTR